MMKLTIGLAKKILRLQQGESLPYSQLQYVLITRMVTDGVLVIRSSGSRRTVYCRDTAEIQSYLQNNFGIRDLSQFITAATKPDLQRSDAVRIASDSKIKTIRSFKGFLVNSCQPVATRLNGIPMDISPPVGTFAYIHDFEKFVPAADVTVIGVENGENFRYVERQQELFPFEKILFVSRYPQSGDLIQWLQSIPNRYVHFGDFDFAGINIYLHEFKSRLGSRASFFVPDGIEDLIRDYGNRKLYDRQCKSAPSRSCLQELELERLWDLIQTEKKGLEQEVLIAAEKQRKNS